MRVKFLAGFTGRSDGKFFIAASGYGLLKTEDDQNVGGNVYIVFNTKFQQ